MKRLLGSVLVTALASASIGLVRADEPDAKAVLDKAIKAMGGEEKLAKATTATWKGKGKITFMGNDNDFTIENTVEGLKRYRGEFSGNFGGNDVKVTTVVDGDKGWRKVNDNTMELEGDMLANAKRTLYLQLAPMMILPLKNDRGFKVESAGEEKVGDAPASVLKVTGPDGKDFKLYFDKKTDLLVKMVATVPGFDGQDFSQETTYSGYKEFDGIKRATKMASKRDGEAFMDSETTEFKILDKVAADTFAEPK